MLRCSLTLAVLAGQAHAGDVGISIDWDAPLIQTDTAATIVRRAATPKQAGH